MNYLGSDSMGGEIWEGYWGRLCALNIVGIVAGHFFWTWVDADYEAKLQSGITAQMRTHLSAVQQELKTSPRYTLVVIESGLVSSKEEVIILGESVSDDFRYVSFCVGGDPFVENITRDRFLIRVKRIVSADNIAEYASMNTRCIKDRRVDFPK